MSLSNEQRALRYMEALERAGKVVRKVVIEGNRVELELVTSEKLSPFDMVDMKVP